ncbi:MAG: shikimate dehydrogenase [Ancrocorticia populi]|uniref:shikimate dehydrogenase n=1 Tax=Ancrocorticia populi TaxID=2175228 RepID=UPI003F905B34
MVEISGHTGLVELLGSPVEHSLSPAIHNCSFGELGIDAVYLVAEATPETVGDAIAGARALGLWGLNVTMPCKNAVIEHLDGLSPAAEIMGAVNTIAVEDGKLIGHNTDGAGLLRSVAEAGFDVVGKKMTVIGAGGAGSAVFTQAAVDGVGQISVFNARDEFYDATEERIRDLASRTGADVKLYDLADTEVLAREISESLVVVDATRVGMAPLDDQSNVQAEWLHAGQAVVDTVYHPLETKLLKIAAEAGATPIDGLGMLLWQAAIAEEIWFGRTMPVDVVRARVFS